MESLKLYICAVFLAVGIFLTQAPLTEAAYLYLDPTSGTVNGTDTIAVKIKINTEGEKPTTTDAIITYDPAVLKVVEVKEPAQAEKFFPRFFLNNKANKVFIGSAILPQGTPQSGDGLIATIIFKGVADGSTTAAIQCESGKTTDSNITLKKNQRVTDIIDCTKEGTTANIVVSGVGGGPSPTTGAGPTVTPRLTPTSGLLPSATPKLASPSPTKIVTPTLVLSLTPTAAPTPVTLPETGAIETTAIAIAIGLGLTLVSIIIKILL